MKKILNKQSLIVGYSRDLDLTGEVFEKIKNLCHNMGDDVSIFTEPNGSATPDRDFFRKALKPIRRGEANTLVLFSFRDAEWEVSDFRDFLKFIRQRKVRLVSIREGFDSNREPLEKALALFVQNPATQKEGLWQ